mgnify:CR=1 FL=1
MKYVDEYRGRAHAQALAREIRQTVTRPHTLMEVCGGQTHAIVKYGIDTLLPGEVALIHGPGCPVCVTPVALVDQAVALAERDEVVFCSFGDMLRVPGSSRDLLSVKAAGGDVRMVYSPLDAVKLAAAMPDKEVAFFAVGFETTAPANALAVLQAERLGLRNFSLLCAQVRVPPALEALLAMPACRVHGFLAAGHVCAVMGYREYEPVAAEHGVPIVVTGFEPADILKGILHCVMQLESGRAEVENQYARSVTRAGNTRAQECMARVFQVVDRSWRGLGTIPDSGLGLADAYTRYDAAQRFSLPAGDAQEDGVCISGDVLSGLKKPNACPAFGKQCTPEHPLGAPMVSSEGACAAYYRYRRDAGAAPAREAQQ